MKIYSDLVQERSYVLTRIILQKNCINLRIKQCIFALKTTPWVKKTRHQTLVRNFAKYWPLFKILSLLHSAGNLH